MLLPGIEPEPLPVKIVALTIKPSRQSSSEANSLDENAFKKSLIFVSDIRKHKN